MPGFSIGVDLGGTNLRIAVMEEGGAQLEDFCSPSEPGRGRERLVGELVDEVRRLSRKYSSSGHFIGLGVGIPGAIDMETGIVYSASNLPDWSGYAARDELQDRLKMPVILENDANCAALGEKWLGAGAGVDDLCMMTLGTGVGGGFLVNGKPWHGVLGMAGEVGHMTVVPEGRSCGCGNHGCLEQYASATAIHRAAMDMVRARESAALAAAYERDRELNAKTVYMCAQAGDKAARRIFVDVGTALGIALANLINVFNLPLYLIGGGVCRAWDLFSPAMFEQLTERSVVFRAGEGQAGHHRATEVKLAQLQDRAGLIGAARLPMIMAERPCVSG